jgi:putative component of membrane protein insertase Oxa1/YidC/SpoIIIJ protein YidD
MNALKLCFLIFPFFLQLSLFAQENTSYSAQFVNLSLASDKPAQIHPSSQTPLLNIYARFISSQDATECVYFPSCSVYMSQSVKKYGLVLGMIKGLDRLLRCDGKYKMYFPLTPDNKMIDLP